MDFSEKLTFLMKLTGATNKVLGDLLGIHQSQISRMRSGARGCPGNGAYVSAMAAWFAGACTLPYQRSALAQALERPTLELPVQAGVLADILTEWLLGAAAEGGSRGEQSLHQYRRLALRPGGDGEAAPGPGIEEAPVLPGEVCTSRGEVLVYFGDEGKRAAVRAFLGYVLKTGEPLQLNVSSDESLRWMVEDGGAFAGELQRLFPLLARQGCTCRRIVGPTATLDYAYAALTMRWLPYYLTGQVTPYYYPRLRDDVYHRMLLAVRGQAAVFSCAIGRTGRSGATWLVTDRAAVDALCDEFEDYLAVCVPYMTLRAPGQGLAEYQASLLDYASLRMHSLQRYNSLPSLSTPRPLLASLRGVDEGALRSFLDGFDRRAALFRESLAENHHTDIFCLATPEEVAAGRVPMAAAWALDGQPRYYTPEGYRRHLEAILRLMEAAPNYHPVLCPPRGEGLGLICVKGDRRALLQRQTAPFALYEVSERNLVAAFGELLRREVPQGEARREAVAERLRSALAR